jgi:hypothetical protein
MACSLGCSLVFQGTSIYLLGVYQDSGQEYFGFSKYDPNSGRPSDTIDLFQISGY